MKKMGNWKEDIRRIANLIMGADGKEKKTICIMGINKVNLQKQICMILGEEISIRKRAVLVIHADKGDTENVSKKTMLDVEEHKVKWPDIVIRTQGVDEAYAVSHDRQLSELLGFGFGEKMGELMQTYDYIIIDNGAIEHQAESVAIAAICDETILLIEKGTVKGNRAMHLKKELDMNGVHVLGSIFVK